jgi:hypothetical protein
MMSLTDREKAKKNIIWIIENREKYTNLSLSQLSLRLNVDTPNYLRYHEINVDALPQVSMLPETVRVKSEMLSMSLRADIPTKSKVNKTKSLEKV